MRCARHNGGPFTIPRPARLRTIQTICKQIAQIAREYRVYYAEHRTGPGPNDYSMDHSSVLYLMSPTGAFIAPVRADQSGEEIAANLKKLMS